MKTKILFYLLLLFLSNSVVGQQLDNSINQTDSSGKKQGLWIVNKEHTMVYYKDGLRNGIFIDYNRKNGRVHLFGEYVDDFPSGKWYYFNDVGILLFTEQNIQRNLSLTRMRDDGVRITPKFTSYVKDYYPSGQIKDEGRVLYNEDPEIDYYKIGKWKYYNKNGELIRTKEEP